MVKDILLEDIIKHAHQICSENNVKLTTKREHVLSALIQASEAMSAYELAEKYRDIFEQNIPAMSVYRILDFLTDHSLVHKLTSANKYIACSHITCSHSHDVPQFLICEICNSVSEISVKKSVMNELTVSVEKTGFKLSTSQLELKGICHSCQE